MTKKLIVVMAQLNLTVGDISGNLAKMIQAAHTARDTLAADIIVFPELALTGYICDDLFLHPAFLMQANKALETFKNSVMGIHCLVTHPQITARGLLNACSVIYNGTLITQYAKQHLPNYSVFDEARYFIAGHTTCVVPIHGISVGVLICEDVWNMAPIQQAARHGAQLILVTNASPFEITKHEQRQQLLAKRAKTVRLPIVYVNCVGGQDEVLFDGGSMTVDANGIVCQHADFFKETLLPVKIEFFNFNTTLQTEKFSLRSEEQCIYDALVMGIRDYVEKHRFPGVLVGVSGGIDSALTLALAVDALGADKVHAVIMPSRYTTNISMEDALAVVNNLGVRHDIISIEPVFKSFLQTLQHSFADTTPDLTEENLQARCRGVLLMAFSNKFGKLVLTTSNRSEMAVGYTTLYGDMAGGFAVLKDVPKTLVYRLAKLRNQPQPVIPERTLTRAPTAELAPNQKDEDSLPPYDVLDKILELYLNEEQDVAEITTQGFDRATVAKVIKLVRKSEYKRRQAPMGVRINQKAFGRDRRLPIA